MGVVIAADQVDFDPLGVEAGHLFVKEKAGVVVAPVAIVDVSGNDDEGDSLVDGELDEIFERAAGGLADRLDGCSFILIEAMQRTVEV